MTNIDPVQALIEEKLRAASVAPSRIERRTFPDEVTYIVYAQEREYDLALGRVRAIESEIAEIAEEPTFVVVRREAVSPNIDPSPVRTGVQDARVAELTRLISARSRVSRVERGFVYIPDSRVNMATATAGRHHLIFGRRGAGKSALLMEARARVEAEGSVTSWTNFQTLRREPPERILLYVIADLLNALVGSRHVVSSSSSVHTAMVELSALVEAEITAGNGSAVSDIAALVPRLQRALSKYMSLEPVELYVFLDDFYYVPRESQPLVLDLLHGVVRDLPIWLKIASIRHLTNWWQASPPLGLQSGQDADLIDLDLTLQDPQGARTFLEGILSAYAEAVGISTLGRVFNSASMERLVLASGAVPRDYLVLAAASITRALRRESAKFVGVQDVNQAAGDSAKAKIQELEEDMAANVGAAAQTLATLANVRGFCIDRHSFTYFLVGYRDKELHPAQYNLLADLMESRLLHLLDQAISDPSQAGSRFEAYMLDLSQYSGARFKQRIQVLDFVDGRFVSRQTRSTAAPLVGERSRDVIGIFRKAPVLELDTLRLHAESVSG